MLCASSSPAVKRRRISSSTQVVTTEHDDDALLPATRTSPSDDRRLASDQSSGLATSLTSDRQLASDQSTAGRLADRRSSEQPSMNPRVTISPLRSVKSSLSRKSDKERITGRGKLSTSSAKVKGRSSSSLDKRKRLSGSDTGKQSYVSVSPVRRRSRNMQLVSLFDSLSRFFSADSGRRRRTAYVNATVSLAQSSFNPRHNFASVQPHQQQAVPEKSDKQAVPEKSDKQAVPQPQKPRQRSLPQKPRQRTVPQPATQKLQPRQQSLPEPPAEISRSREQLPKRASRSSELKTKTFSARNAKATVKDASAECENDAAQKADESLKAGDASEMKDLMTASVAESESKLFHTAQTIAQQVV